MFEPAPDWGNFDQRYREREEGQDAASTSLGLQIDESIWDSTIPGDITAAVEAIVSEGAPALDHFMGEARAFKNISGNTFFTAAEDISTQLAIEYTWNLGAENVLLIVRPTNTGGQLPVPLPEPSVQTIDMNFDGYVAVFFSQNSQSGGPKPITVDVYMNGYIMLTNVPLPTTTSSGFVFAFGATALRCQSILDPPVVKPSTNPLAASPGLAPQVLPGRGDNPAGSDPVGNAVKAWPQEFVYGLFGGSAWTAGQNPAQFIPTSGGGTPAWQLWTDDPFFNIPQMQSGLLFTNALKSPLKPTGMNYLTVVTSPGSQDVGEVANQAAAVAEFYDRTELRNVSQSWQDTDNTLDIAANDRPLQWATSFRGGAFNSPGITIGFDLTAGVKHEGATTDSGFGPDDCWVPPDGPPTNTVTNSGLSDAQAAILGAYQAQVQAVLDAFEAAQAPIIDAASTAFGVADGASGDALFVASTVFEFWFGSNDTYNAELNAAFPDIGGFGELDIILSDPASQSVINGIIGDSVLAADFTTLNTANAAKAAALAALLAAEDVEPPLPPAPPGLSPNIGQFDFQQISVSGGNWSIG